MTAQLLLGMPTMLHLCHDVVADIQHLHPLMKGGKVECVLALAKQSIHRYGYSFAVHSPRVSEVSASSVAAVAAALAG